eukprot:1919137-Alexandrium_andersonii.AAC.1
MRAMCRVARITSLRIRVAAMMVAVRIKALILMLATIATARTMMTVLFKGDNNCNDTGCNCNSGKDNVSDAAKGKDKDEDAGEKWWQRD